MISIQVALKKKIPQHPDIWFAKDINTLAPSGISTGYDNLDSALPNKGWPKNGLVEIEYQATGNGELRLVVPALRELSQSRNQWITWINPPLIPYAPGLQSLGVDTGKILLIHTKQNQDTLWSLEKSCKSKNCSAVLAWINRPFSFKETQRLQLAAKVGGNVVYLFYPGSNHTERSSASELRLLLKTTAQPGTINVDVSKKRRGWPVRDIAIDVSQVIDTSDNQLIDIKEKLHLWRDTKNMPVSGDKLKKDYTPSSPTHKTPTGQSTRSHLLQ